MAQAPKPRWTPEEVEKAEKIISTMKEKVDRKVVANNELAATIAGRQLKYLSETESFADLPTKIKQFLKYTWRLEGERKSDMGQSDILTPEKLEDAKAEWHTLYDNNPTFRHGMTHPDDE